MALKDLVKEADLIFVGVVEQLGIPPLCWSGTVKSTQKVTYSVSDVLKGKYTESKIDVHHLIIENSKTVKSDKPELSPTMFKKGNKLIVFAIIRRHPYLEDRYEDFNPDEGVMKYTDSTALKIKDIASGL